MQAQEGEYRIVAIPMHSNTPPDPSLNWRARADIYHWSSGSVVHRVEPAEWFGTCEAAEFVAIGDGIRAVRKMIAKEAAESIGLTPSPVY